MLKFLQSDEVRPHVEQFSKQRGDRYFDILNTENIEDCYNNSKYISIKDLVLEMFNEYVEGNNILYFSTFPIFVSFQQSVAL